jgi:hypothetical protein
MFGILFYFRKNLPLNCGDFQAGTERTLFVGVISCPTSEARRTGSITFLRGARKTADLIVGSVRVVEFTRRKRVTEEASGTYGILFKTNERVSNE